VGLAHYPGRAGIHRVQRDPAANSLFGEKISLFFAKNIPVPANNLPVKLLA
jgi:hypothetical protein